MNVVRLRWSMHFAAFFRLKQCIMPILQHHAPTTCWIVGSSPRYPFCIIVSTFYGSQFCIPVHRIVLQYDSHSEFLNAIDFRKQNFSPIETTSSTQIYCPYTSSVPKRKSHHLTAHHNSERQIFCWAYNSRNKVFLSIKYFAITQSSSLCNPNYDQYETVTPIAPAKQNDVSISSATHII